MGALGEGAGLGDPGTRDARSCREPRQLSQLAGLFRAPSGGWAWWPGRGPRGDRSDARAAAEDADAASQIPLDRHVCAFPKCGSEAAGPMRLHAAWTVGV